MNKVKCISRGGYDHMREGEIGTLIEKQQAHHEPGTAGGFTWPEYWVVETADGRRVHGHAHRFVEVE